MWHDTHVICLPRVPCDMTRMAHAWHMFALCHGTHGTCLPFDMTRMAHVCVFTNVCDSLRQGNSTNRRHLCCLNKSQTFVFPCLNESQTFVCVCHMCVCMHVCVCTCVQEKEGRWFVRVSVCVRARSRVCLCVCACARACLLVCIFLCKQGAEGKAKAARDMDQQTYQCPAVCCSVLQCPAVCTLRHGPADVSRHTPEKSN